MDKQSGIVLIGGGGHCCSVIDTIRQSGQKIIGVLDTPDKIGGNVLGVPIIGCDDDIPRYVPDYLFLVTVGQIKDASLRLRLHNLVKQAGGSFATVISPKASVSPDAKIGEGSVALNFTSVNALASIGRGCIINTGAIIEHNVAVGDFTHISTGAIVNGNARIGSRSFIGSGAVIGNGVTIADDVVIGASSVVVNDIIEPGIYFGNPVRKKNG